MPKREFDYVLVGGGLQNGLLTLALRAAGPLTRIALIELADRLGGNHTWCFHASDVPAGADAWISPLVVHRWPGYRVVFPNFRRHIDGPYSAITSERLHEVVASRIGPRSELLLGTNVTGVGPHEVTIDGGRTITGEVVVDARGPGAGAPTAGGYQKFLGLEVELGRPHGLDLPILMDATVDQEDGFHFVYILPLGPERALVEDTRFHEADGLDAASLRKSVHAYCDARELDVRRIIREERGILPMPWRDALPPAQTAPLLGGYRGGWFHPGTGYSFPVAARLASFVAGNAGFALDGHSFHRLRREHNQQARYCHLLNQFLFRWYPAGQRWHIFERFYRMPVRTIERFYALRMTVADRVRLLAGRPPRGLSLAHRLRRRVS